MTPAELTIKIKNMSTFALQKTEKIWCVQGTAFSKDELYAEFESSLAESYVCWRKPDIRYVYGCEKCKEETLCLVNCYDGHSFDSNCDVCTRKKHERRERLKRRQPGPDLAKNEIKNLEINMHW